MGNGVGKVVGVHRRKGDDLSGGAGVMFLT